MSDLALQNMVLRRGIPLLIGTTGSGVSRWNSAVVSRFFSEYSEVQMVQSPKPFSPGLLKLPLAKYGGIQTVTILPGDGIGPEMMNHVKTVFRVAQAPIDFEDLPLNSLQASDNADLENAIISIERNGVALKGNIETDFTDLTTRSRNVELRVRLDLFANVLWCKTIPGIPCKHSNVDIVLIRENTEGEYSGIEHETVPGVVESLKIVTRKNIERIANFAFENAQKYNRSKVTVIHKANIMKIADGLFLKVCEDMAGQYSGIQFDNMIIDNASMQMVQRPQQFDLVLMPNLYGNILSNIACGIVGGPGLFSGVNIGDKYALFETGTRNTGTNLAGKDIANPASFLRAGVDMLYYLGLNKYAKLIYNAVMNALTIEKVHTPDIGGSNKTSEFIESVCHYIKREMK